MTSNELKRMNRTELLQMMLLLAEENEQLKAQLAQVQEQLDEKNLKCEKAGSLAEAALQVNGVFEAAEKAARQYVQGVEQMYRQKDLLCREAEEKARKRANSIMAEADAYRAAAIREADEYWEHVRTRVRGMMQEQVMQASTDGKKEAGK